MKKHIIVRLVICTWAVVVLLSSCSSNKVWEQPDILYSNSTLTVKGMERQADRTVLHLSIQGQPGNNFRIQSTTYLAGDKGKKYALTGSEGVILDQWVPFSEDVKSFDLYFEPVKGRNRALDLIEPRGWMIYGIHDADKPLKIRPAKEQEPIKDENVFFKKGTGKLNGRFEGSDHPEMIQFFGYNAFQENNLQTCKVASDGSFSFEIPLENPILSYLWSENSSSPLYFFLTPDGEADIQIDSTGLVHYPLGSRCGELAGWLSNAAPSFHFSLNGSMPEERDSLGIGSFFARVSQYCDRMLMLADYVSGRQGFSKEEVHLLKQNIRILAATRELSSVLDFQPAMGIGQEDFADPSLYISMAKLDPEDWTAFTISNDILSLSNYYQFLGPMRGIMDDVPKMMAVDSAIFHQPGPSIFLQAVFMNGQGLSQEVKINKQLRELYKANGSQQSQSFDYHKIWDARLSALSSPYLKARYQATLDELLAESEDRYDLPAGEATDIFRRLVDPFRGKWVYVDFWDIGCAPCKMGIESSVALRKKIAEMDNLELVFITGDRSTPPKTYEEYVAKYMAGETSYLIPEAESMLLRTLFKFNAIPHNELVDPDGRIVRGKNLPRLEWPDFLNQLELAK